MAVQEHEGNVSGAAIIHDAGFLVSKGSKTENVGN